MTRWPRAEPATCLATSVRQNEELQMAVKECLEPEKCGVDGRCCQPGC